jgi:hypothetical protein
MRSARGGRAIRANPRVERLEERRQPEPEEETEGNAEDGVADRLRLDLHRSRRRTDEDRARRLERQERLELVGLGDQRQVLRRIRVALGLELVQLLLDPLLNVGNRLGIEIALVPGELPRILRREGNRKLSILALYGERQDVAVRTARDRRDPEQVGRRPVL